MNVPSGFANVCEYSARWAVTSTGSPDAAARSDALIACATGNAPAVATGNKTSDTATIAAADAHATARRAALTPPPRTRQLHLNPTVPTPESQNLHMCGEVDPT
ncbi:hypothetical protein GCM10010390_62100 [Streptomyces mordarskii]|uniref:Uncharacterized protein n=1 Tax=Streptomyces mordarskii TaxID=1226758 RepID=A0ABP3NRT2_9ACTN